MKGHRFLIQLSVGYPGPKEETKILRRRISRRDSRGSVHRRAGGSKQLAKDRVKPAEGDAAVGYGSVVEEVRRKFSRLPVVGGDVERDERPSRLD